MFWYLKHCPFCGAIARFFQVEQPDGTVMYAVDCSNQECPVAPFTPLCEDEKTAAEAWNRRASNDE